MRWPLVKQSVSFNFCWLVFFFLLRWCSQKSSPPRASIIKAKGRAVYQRSTAQVQIPPRSQRRETVQEVRGVLATAIGPIPGMRVQVKAQTEMMLARMLSFGGDDVEVEIRGYDLEKADRMADRVAELMRQVPGLINVNIQRPDRRPELSVHVDRVKASLVGVSVRDIAETLDTTIRGTEATLFREDGDEFNVLGRLRDADRDGLPDIGRVGVTTGGGRVVALRDLVGIGTGKTTVEK